MYSSGHIIVSIMDYYGLVFFFVSEKGTKTLDVISLNLHIAKVFKTHPIFTKG